MDNEYSYSRTWSTSDVHKQPYQYPHDSRNAKGWAVGLMELNV
jgi:hypothetical protein